MLTLADLAAEELARRDLLAFVLRTHPTYRPGWVHRDVCARLERFSADVAAGRSPRLILQMPPQHGKSTLVARRWPVWHLGRHPTHKIVCGSYGADLANQASLEARAVCEGYGAALWPHLAPGMQWAVNQWQIEGGGSYKAVGVGSALAGHGAHAVVLDDLVKDAEEAQSEARRDAIWEWYRTVAYTRLAPGGGVLFVSTRWHEDDPIGRVLRSNGEGGTTWEVASYPAIAEVDEPHRNVGEPLAPSLYDLAHLEQIRASVGSRAWSALYQQRPAPAEGALFRREWFRHYSGPPELLKVDQQAITVDCSFKDTRGADFVVMQVWGKHDPRTNGGADRFLLDQVRGRFDYPATKAALRDLRQRWPKVRLVLVEDKANGPALIADLRHEVPGVVGYNPTSSKMARAQQAAVYFEAGNVHLPQPAYCPWVVDYLEELASFPYAPHDDQVDATTQLLLRWAEDLPTVQVMAPWQVRAMQMQGRWPRGI